MNHWTQPFRGRFGVFADRIFGAAVAGAVCVGVASATPIGPNLVVNGGAENSPGATTGTGVLAPAGWSVTGNFTAAQYGAWVEFPSLVEPGPANRGTRLFSGGPNSALSTAAQVINVTDLAASIDSGAMTYAAGAFLGGFSNQDDIMLLALTFTNSSGQSILATTLQGPSAALRGNQTGLLPQGISGAMPVGTRTINLVMIAQRISGAGYNDAYADEVSFAVGRRCVADFDDGSGTGTLDDGVTIDDLIYYLGLFEAGDQAADVDDGSGTGTLDGGVTIDDLIYYLLRFEGGC
jgi:hypothetical protein